MRFGLPLLAAMASAIAPAAASAAAPREPIRLSWVRGDGAEQCPGAQAIEASVRERLGRDPFRASAQTHAEVVVERRSDELVARIRVRDAGGALLGERELTSEGGACASLATAAALALALYVDPEAALAPKPAPPPAPPPPTPPSPPAHAERPLARAPAAAPRVEAAILAGASIADGLLPGAAPMARFAADATVLGRARFGGHALLAPESRTRDERFAFGLAAMGPSACIEVVRTERLRVAPCVAGLFGEVHAVVYTLEPTRPGGRFWAGADVAARARALLVGPLAAEVGLVALVPLTRHSFDVIGEAAPSFQQRPVVVAADLSVGMHFR